MQRIIASGPTFASMDINLGLLAFRLFVGLTMAFGHGLGKLPPSEQFVGYIGAIGMPAPLIMAWAAGLSEFAGGLLVALGLATRWAALSVAVTMGVAAFGAHGADPFAKKELALLYLAAFGLLALLGSGKFSVDRLIRK